MEEAERFFQIEMCRFTVHIKVKIDDFENGPIRYD